MGGEVLELLADRIERLEREAREEGIAQGSNIMTEAARKCGVNEDVIAQAKAATLADIQTAREQCSRTAS